MARRQSLLGCIRLMRVYVSSDFGEDSLLETEQLALKNYG